MVYSLERIAWQWATKRILEDNTLLQLWRESSYSPLDLDLVMGEPMCWPKRFRRAKARSRFRVAVKSLLCRVANKELPFNLSFSNRVFELFACGDRLEDVIDSLRTRILYISPAESNTVTHFLHDSRPFVLVGPLALFDLLPGQVDFNWSERIAVPKITMGSYPRISFVEDSGSSEVERINRG